MVAWLVNIYHFLHDPCSKAWNPMKSYVTGTYRWQCHVLVPSDLTISITFGIWHRLFIDLLKVHLESSQSADPSPPDRNTVGEEKFWGLQNVVKKKHGCLSWIIWILHLRRFEFDLRKCQVLFTFVQCPKSLRIGTLTLSLYRTAKWWKQNITSEEHEHRYSVHYVGYSSYKYFVPL